MKARDIIDFNPITRVTRGANVPFVEMAALPTGHRFIPEISKREAVSSGSKFIDGDTLFARITPCLENGKGGFVSGLGDRVVGQGSTEFIVFRAKNVQDRDFVYYLSRHPVFRSFAEKGMAGTSGRQRVAWQTLAEFEMADLAPEYRQKCGEILSSFDDKIELNRRMNETLEAIARAVFKDWFVDFGPTRRKAAGITDPAAILGGLLPDPTRAAPLAALFPDSFGENDLPEGWKERPFVGFLDIIGGGTPKTKVPEYWNGDMPWFSVVDTPPNGGVFVWYTEKTITERGVAESSVRVIPEGTTIISARGTVGNIAMAARPMTFNQSCYALRAVAPVGNIFVYLATERMVERLKAMAHGSVFSTITRATFESLNFAWAKKDVLSGFEALITPFFELIKANGQENQALAATRDLLLPKLMSGELRLKDAEGVE